MSIENPNIHVEIVSQPPLPKVGEGLPVKAKEIKVEEKPQRLETPKYTPKEIRELDEGLEYWQK